MAMRKKQEHDLKEKLYDHWAMKIKYIHQFTKEKETKTNKKLQNYHLPKNVFIKRTVLLTIDINAYTRRSSVRIDSLFLQIIFAYRF